jgi:two-component system chemotaxis response regulator CheB
MTELDVIMIGGSAGGLEALLAILPGLPAAFAIPIVVVFHLSPSQPSLLADVLSRACRRRVAEIEDKMALLPHTIHVAPPNYHVLLERDRTIALSVDPPVHFSRPSIDVAFDSAADSFGRTSAGVLLSGASEDGARGLARIHRAGGLALIQDPASARHPEMPAAAVHWVGPGAQVHLLPELASAVSALGGILTSHQDCAR